MTATRKQRFSGEGLGEAIALRDESLRDRDGDWRARRANNRRAVLNGNTHSANLAAPINRNESTSSERSAAGRRRNLWRGLCAIGDLYQSLGSKLAQEIKDVRLAAFGVDFVLTGD